MKQRTIRFRGNASFPCPPGSAEKGLEVLRYLLEHHERLGPDPIVFHRRGCFVGLHELLKGLKVRHFHNQPYAVGVRRVGQQSTRDTHRAETKRLPAQVMWRLDDT